MTEEVEIYAGHSYDDRSGSRRRFNLTNEDLDAITAIIEAVVYKQQHTDINCRFRHTKPEDMDAAIEFFRTFNAAWGESKSTIRKTFVAILVTLIMGLMGGGVIYEITRILKEGK